MARTDPRPHYGKKRRVRRDGYIDVFDPAHPLARRDGYVMEHRKVAWDAGLLTSPTGQVHHRNHRRNDNRLENLEVKSAPDHSRDHAEERGVATNQYGTFPVKPRDKRVSAPKPQRQCEFCGEPIPPTMRRDARYCSGGCRITAWKRAHVGRPS